MKRIDPLEMTADSTETDWFRPPGTPSTTESYDALIAALLTLFTVQNDGQPANPDSKLHP